MREAEERREASGRTSRDDIFLRLLHISALHSWASSIWEQGAASSRENLSLPATHHRSSALTARRTPLRYSGEQRDDISHCPPRITALLLSLNGPVLLAFHQCSINAHLVALADMARDVASDNLQMVAGGVASDNLQMVERDVASDNLKMVAGD
ncbi:hypothetical protein AB205_0061350, partial [Aquarana catesbeiana]